MIELKAMPFDSNEILDPNTGETSFDRVAYSKDLADWMRAYFGNGVLVKGGNVLGDQLKVIHKEGLTCTVKAGEVCINGRTGWLESDTDMAVDMGGAQPRVDRIVMELNIPNDRGIYLKVLKGTPADEPAAPGLVQTEDVFQIPLADIKIAAVSATVGEIIDMRPDYISNVTIGIKPPTGNDAETVKVSDETAALYEGVANVDECLQKTINLSSYQAFCANVNTTSLDAAFGKNNEGAIHLLGKQLAMYARFKGEAVDFNNDFKNLVKKDSLTQILADTASSEEALVNPNITALIAASPYAKGLLNTLEIIIYEVGNEFLDITDGWSQGYCTKTTGSPANGGSFTTTKNSDSLYVYADSPYESTGPSAFATFTANKKIIYPKGVRYVKMRAAVISGYKEEFASYGYHMSASSAKTTVPFLGFSQVTSTVANEIWFKVPDNFNYDINAFLNVGVYARCGVNNGKDSASFGANISKIWFTYTI